MGNVHSFTSNGQWLSQKNVDDIKKLVKAAQDEHGVRLYGDLANLKDTYNSQGEQVVVGVGEPTIHSARIAFSAPGQEDVNISFAERGNDFIHSQGSQKLSHQADMLTGAIMLYLAENDKIEYFPAGISFDNMTGQSIVVDGDIHDSYNFVENVLGAGTLDDIETVALRGQDDYLDPDEPYSVEVLDGSIPLVNTPKPNMVPLNGRSGSTFNGADIGRCGAWMPRANDSCVLTLGHMGSHRSR